MLLDRLQLWAVARPEPDSIAQAMSVTALLHADWRDRRSLANAVLAVVQFVHQRGYLTRTYDASWPARMEAATADMDWLDIAVLRHGLLNLFSPELAQALPAHLDLPGRPLAGGAAPRQQVLLTELLALPRRGEVSVTDPESSETGGVSPADAGSSENALRIYAAYIALHPERAGDPLVTELIKRLLQAVAWIARSSSTNLAIERLQRHDMDGVLQLLSGDHRPAASLSLRFVADMGESATRLVAALLHKPDSADTEGADSPSAGAALLIRALLDSRLHSLVDDRGGLLLALFSRWAGQEDTSLRLLAAAPEEATSNLALPAGFNQEWLDVLFGLRLVTTPTAFLHQITLSDGSLALVLGDGAMALWPLGRIIYDTAEIAPTVEQWIDMWSSATGAEPTLIVDYGLASILHTSSVASIVTPEDGSDLQLDYQANADALMAALEALSLGHLGELDGDLQVTLLAVALVRLWTRWLSRFSESSVPYVLRNFIRRAGTIHAHAEGLTVDLEPMPLDIVLELSGYLEEIVRVPWLDGRSIRFRIRGRGAT
jgi:hypothetical protein